MRLNDLGGCGYGVAPLRFGEKKKNYQQSKQQAWVQKKPKLTLAEKWAIIRAPKKADRQAGKAETRRHKNGGFDADT
jgi:uncharacterized membrane protein YqiK